MAFIDVFTVETEHRSIYGVPSRDDKSTKVFILEYLLVRVPDDTLEKSRLIYQYEKYNIGDSVTEQSETGGVGQPIPIPTPFIYLKRDGTNTMDDDYVPTNPKSVITLDYFQSNGSGISLGELHTEAYYGDLGKIAYDHSQTAHSPNDAEANRPISDSLTLISSTTSASSAAVQLLNTGKSNTAHDHDADYEPLNSNIQTHIATALLHIQYFEDLLDTGSYSGNQGKLVKVNATEDGLIYGDPSGTTVSWGDIAGTLGLQTDLQAVLDAKVDDTQVLTNVPSGALFTDENYSKDTEVTAHLIDYANPHQVSAADVGLSSADNTADADKPISTDTQTALNLKEDDLGNPSVDNHVLKSTVAGTRSWFNPLELTEIPADTEHTGIIVEMTAGENIDIGDQLYLKSDGKLWKANAAGVDTFPVIAMASKYIVADTSDKMLLYGIITNSSWTLTIGAQIYLDTSNGGMTQIKPTNINEVIQVIGVATGTDRILFNPGMADIVSTVEDIIPPATLVLDSIEEL